MSIITKIINFIESKIELSKFCSYGTTIFNILDNTTELWMTKYIIGEFLSCGGATFYKNPSDQTVKATATCQLTYLNILKLIFYRQTSHYVQQPQLPISTSKHVAEMLEPKHSNASRGALP